jgi:hypothetical protein
VSANITDLATQIMALIDDGYERGRRAGIQEGLRVAQRTIVQLLPEPNEVVEFEPPDNATTANLVQVPFGDGNPEERL